jgi:predicted permease
MLPDLRYALRLLARAPAFTAVAIASLALGIGANTAIYSLFYTIMLRPLPVAHPEQIVQFLRNTPTEPRSDGYWGWDRFTHIRDHNHVFSALTATSFDNLADVHLPGADRETLVLENVAGNYFDFLGLHPTLGRLITPSDVPAIDSGDAVVISYDYWATRLHSDPAVLGRRIFYRDAPKTIIGVAPRDYVGPRVGNRTDIWQPCADCDVVPLARLKPGVPLAQAEAEVNVLYRATPKSANVRVVLDPAGMGLSRVRDRYGKSLILLLAIVGLLLLLACINLAGMLLARAAARQREFAVRISLGAGARHLVRQLLAESLLLSTAGALAGIFVAWTATTILIRIMAAGRGHERVDLEVHPDLHLLLFTAALALLTGVLFGLAPAMHALRAAPGATLRRTGIGLGKSLVAAQVALSLLLLTSATLFLGHLSHLRNFDLGFRSDHVLLVTVDPTHAGYSTPQLAAAYQDLLLRLNTIPGVRSASMTGCSPLQGCGNGGTLLTAEGHPEPPDHRVRVNMTIVAPRYFETLGIPLFVGRDFAPRAAAQPRVAIVNQAMARIFFPGANPIGKHVTRDSITPPESYEIIGVAEDAKAIELHDPPYPTIYFDMFQTARLHHQFELRTAADPQSLAPTLRRILRDALPRVPINRMTTLDAQVDSNIVPEHLIATLSTWFAALAAALSAIGLYGLLAYTVARRTAEIGIRMALGATPDRVARLILRDALTLVAAGLVAGVWLVVSARPVLAAVLHDLQWRPALPLAVAAAVTLVAALIASLVPLLRATRVDPMHALRSL